MGSKDDISLLGSNEFIVGKKGFFCWPKRDAVLGSKEFIAGMQCIFAPAVNSMFHLNRTR